MSKAKWIWKSEKGAADTNAFAYLRKEFQLQGEVESAAVRVTAHNFFQLFVNGSKVGGYGSPVPSDPQKSKYTLHYEVAHLLHEGANCVASVTHYLGGDGQNYVNGVPGFWLELHIRYRGGGRDEIVTDGSWQALIKTPHLDGTPYQQNRRISAIEDYDGRLYDPAWLQSDYPAELTHDVCISEAEHLGWELRMQQVPEGEVEEFITPQLVGESEAGVYVFDAGKIISGFPQLRMPGIPNATIMLRYSEQLDDHGRVMHNVCNETSDHYYDKYTMRGDEWEQWSPDFSYKAFRYIEITGYPGEMDSTYLTLYSAHTAMEYIGSFRSSSELLNRIYDACIQTQKNNVLGQIVDCPHREQAQYLADADLQAETLIYNFRAFGMLEKVLSDFTDAQKEDGTFPFVFPSNVECPDFSITIPEWDLHFCILLWKLYYYQGSSTVIERYLPVAIRMLDAYCSRIDERGLLPLGEGWHISDWPYPQVEHKGSYLAVQNMKLYDALVKSARMAAVIGLEQECSRLNAIAISLKDAIIAEFYNDTLGRFEDSSESERSSQGVNVLGIQFGLIDGSARDSLLTAVADEEWTCSTLLSLNLMQVLFENGYAESAYRILSNEEFPGWGYMISQGYQTVWEGFDDIESHCHAWNGYPARLMAEYMVGIRALAPGFENTAIQPYLPDDLTWAEAAVATPYGVITAGWHKGEQSLKLSCSIPPGIACVIVIPEQANGAITIEQDRERIQVLSHTPSVELEAGEYVLRIEWI
ncbi:family 78 glycoside hydrolase catalytic domain [Paenibacillus sp. SAF-054]|uniref:family 78 glycoside hydrolase catalytic domain n=1 Tax=unclassified Paenibacillus TaxID=185978 RepID=UPI003F7F6D2A